MNTALNATNVCIPSHNWLQCVRHTWLQCIRQTWQGRLKACCWCQQMLWCACLVFLFKAVLRLLTCSRYMGHWVLFLTADNLAWDPDYMGSSMMVPVVYVTLFMAVIFCSLLGKHAKENACVVSEPLLRLCQLVFLWSSPVIRVQPWSNMSGTLCAFATKVSLMSCACENHSSIKSCRTPTAFSYLR